MRTYTAVRPGLRYVFGFARRPCKIRRRSIDSDVAVTLEQKAALGVLHRQITGGGMVGW